MSCECLTMSISLLTLLGVYYDLARAKKKRKRYGMEVILNSGKSGLGCHVLQALYSPIQAARILWGRNTRRS